MALGRAIVDLLQLSAETLKHNIGLTLLAIPWIDQSGILPSLVGLVVGWRTLL
jgi:hypothetical protein